MIMDWTCPNCEEKHLSEIINHIEIGNVFSLKCSDCNTNADFEVKQKKYLIICNNSDKNIFTNATAWE